MSRLADEPGSANPSNPTGDSAPRLPRDESTESYVDPELMRLYRQIEDSPDRAAALEQACRERPDLADRLRRVFAGVQMVGSAGSGLDPDMPSHLGEFRLIECIARGGMGEIFRAVQTRLGREVAIKVIRRGRVAATAADRFEREQRALARLHQTNIIPIYSAGTEGDIPYFAMPYIEGVNLASVLKKAHRDDGSAARAETPSLDQLAHDTPLDALAHSGVNREATGEGANETFPPAPAPRKLRHSRASFHSIARSIAEAAEALSHAHAAGVIHRDVKPSNMMLARDGRLFLIDFGLARLSSEASEPQSQRNDDPALIDAGSLTGEHWLGTPAYMAPEQALGIVAPANDVFGLGATMYEMLTHRPAFRQQPEESPAAFLERRLNEGPRPIADCVRHCPWELRAICEKAMQPQQSARYASSGEMAADLRAFLRGEPISLCGRISLRRPVLWVRRHRARAALAVMAVAGLIGFVFQYTHLQDAKVEAAEADLRKTNAEAETLRQKDLEHRRAEFLQQMERIQLAEPRREGWSKRAWNLGVSAAELNPDAPPRSELAATLVGLDAVPELNKEGVTGSSLAFDKAADRLFVGGTSTADGKPEETAKMYDLRTLQWTNLGLPGAGPVGFRSDDTPLQVVPTFEGGMKFRVWNIDGQGGVAELTAPILAPARPLDGDDYPIMELSPNADLFAATVALDNNQRATVVWSIATGVVVYAGSEQSTALAFSSDSSLLAWGDASGQIGIVALATGQAVYSARGWDQGITCLAFAKDYLRRPKSQDNVVAGWLLAVGNESGGLEILDLTVGRPRSICRGMPYQISGIRFSHDACLVAGLGYQQVIVWNVATGESLLESVGGNSAAIAYSANGDKLATATVTEYGAIASTTVYRLINGPAQMSYFGLSTPVEACAISHDGQLVAALSHDWRVGVWNVTTGELLHVFLAPRGWFADNVAIAFSPDHSKLWCASYTQAVEWDLATGNETRNWNLPPALANRLACDSQRNRLTLMRAEAKGGIPLHTAAAMDRKTHPRLVRAYDLNSAEWQTPFFESTALPRNIEDAAISSNGKVALLTGSISEKDDRWVVCFDLESGEKKWDEAIRGPYSRFVWIDPIGAHARYARQTDDPAIVELSSGHFVADSPNVGRAMGPGMRWGVGAAGAVPRNYLWENGTDSRLELWHLPPQRNNSVVFDARPQVARMAYGTNDGTVILCDITAVHSRLAAVRAGW